MFELSLNIMDIAQNSIRAKAALVTARVVVDVPSDMITIVISDDGSGMSDETRSRVTDPFYTTRTTRKVGLGLPYYEMTARMCDGDFSIESEPGKGTSVLASFRLSHIDRAPLGDMGQTFALLAGANPATDFLLTFTVCRGKAQTEEFVFDTREIKELLEGVGIGTPEVVVYIEGLINEGIENISGGIAL